MCMKEMEKHSEVAYTHKEVVYTVYKDPDNFYNESLYDTVDICKTPRQLMHTSVGDSYSYGHWFDFYFIIKAV